MTDQDSATSANPVDLPIPGWLDRLRSSLDDPGEPYRPTQLKRRPAAVLILFGEGSGGPELLFIERAAGLRAHPGQVAFPGGGYEDGDQNLANTAIREAAEETGLDPHGVTILGELATVEVPISGYRVTPVLAWWSTPSPVGVVDPGEVARVREVPIAELTDPANRYLITHPGRRFGPGFLIGDFLIWGLTAHLLNGVLTRAGWQRPWDEDRTLDIPDRYLGRRD